MKEFYIRINPMTINEDREVWEIVDFDNPSSFAWFGSEDDLDRLIGSDWSTETILTLDGNNQFVVQQS